MREARWRGPGCPWVHADLQRGAGAPQSQAVTRPPPAAPEADAARGACSVPSRRPELMLPPTSVGPGRAAIPGDGLVQDKTRGLRWPRLPNPETQGGAGQSDRPRLSLTPLGTGTSQSQRDQEGGLVAKTRAWRRGWEPCPAAP